MNNLEAIAILKDGELNPCVAEDREACEMAIEALEQRRCDDCISRQWLMECVEEGWIEFDTEKDKNKFIHLVRDTAPSAQPELIEKEAYIRGFEQGRTQGMIDAQGRRMTKEEIDLKKHVVCCPVCDNRVCVRGTASCEAEIWARSKKEEGTDAGR